VGSLLTNAQEGTHVTFVACRWRRQGMWRQ